MFQRRLKWFFRLFVFCVAAAVIGIVYYNADIIIEVTNIDVIIPFINDYKENYVQFHRQLESMLLDAEEYIEKENYLKALLKIRTVVALLDNRYYDAILPNSYVWTKKVPKNLSTSENANQSTFKEKVSFGVNLFESTISEPKIRLSSVAMTTDLHPLVTVLINDCENRIETNLFDLISQIRSEWVSLKIVLAANYKNLPDFERKLKNVQNFAYVLCDSWNQIPMEAALEYVTTPYILVLSSVSAVTSDLNITRLLITASGLNAVGVVGIAERGTDAGWDYTCLQLNIQNAHLNIMDGYEYSVEACLLCDVTSFSFLVDSSVLREVLPDSSLPMDPRQLDWAIRLQNANIVTLTCPDVMIHTNKNIIYDKKPDNEYSYLPHEENIYFELKLMYINLAQKFKLQKISFSNGTQLEYSCLELNYTCDLTSTAQTRKLNPCCLKEKEMELKKINNINKNLLIPYKLDGISLLETVKYKHSIHPDIDSNIDISIHPDIDITMQYHYIDLLHKRYKENFLEYEILQTIPSDLDKLDNTRSYSKMQNNNSNLSLWFSNEYLDYFTKDSTHNVPNNIPCLLFGYYNIPVFDFINNSSEIIKNIYTELNHTQYRNNETVASPFRELAREPKCFLYSLVRVGEIWIPAPFNPGKHVWKIFGDYIYN